MLIKKKQLSRGDKYAIAALVAIAVITHVAWLFNFSVFTSGDWWYISIPRYLDFAHFSPIWVTEGFGTTSAVPPFYFIRFLEGVLTLLGASFVLTEKLFFFLPFIFGSTLGAYLLVRQYFSPWLSFIGAIIFAFNTAILFNYAGALTIGTAYALAPPAIYLFRRYLQEPQNAKLLIGNGLLFALITAYEQRIALLIVGIACGLYIFNALTDEADKMGYFKERIFPVAKCLGLALGLHAFWLIPYIINAASGVTFSNLLSQQLFESFSDIQNALTLHHPFWTGARPATFIIQDIPFYAWCIPLAAFAGIFVWWKHAAKEVGYWAIVALVGIFLVKQVNEPFIDAYPWLFDHIPGFAAFRESSKFYLLVALSYSILIPFTLHGLGIWLKGRIQQRVLSVSLSRVVFVAISCAILCLFLINVKPLITGQFRTLYAERHKPADYEVLERLIMAQPDHFRLMWVPVVSRWGTQTNVHPSIAATQVNQGAWLSQLSFIPNNQFATFRDQVTKLFHQNSADTMLDRASIKYVIIPLRDMANEDDVFRNYGDDRQYYIDELDKANYLKRVDIGTKDVIVYENQNYQPHFSAATNLQSLALTKDTGISPLYDFITNELKLPFNFVVNKGEVFAYPQTAVRNVFQNLSSDNLQKGRVATSLDTANMRSPQLYINTAGKQVRYVIEDGEIRFYGKPPPGLKVNGKPVEPSSQAETLLAAQHLDADTQYYLVLNEGIAELNRHNSQKQLGMLNGPINLYAVTGGNALPNHSFETGPWQPEVKDCNAYDNKPQISMEITADEYTEGSKSLQLNADRHTACTETAAQTVTSGQYLLTLDYMAFGAKTVGYEVVFDGDEKRKIKKDIDILHSHWQTSQSVIAVPQGATTFKVRLLGYPDYRQRLPAIINYDNVRLLPLSLGVSLDSDPPQYRKLSLNKADEVKFGYVDENQVQKRGNLVSNGSFEQGFWQKKVSDCNSYDKFSDIDMKLIKNSQQGGKALELQARRHSACTGSGKIPVTELRNYLLSFDYQSPTERSVRYLVQFNDPKETILEERVRVAKAGWQNHTKQIQAPLGATEMKITVFADEHGTGAVRAVTRYDSFAVQEIPIMDNYYVVDALPSSLAAPRNISFELKGATKKLVHIKGATTPLYLNMSENYNPLWRAELKNAKAEGFLNSWIPWAKPDAISKNNHFKLNDFENGWYIDPVELCKSNVGCTRHPDGSYDMELIVEFTSQRYFYLGGMISGLLLAGSVGYVGYRTYKDRRRYKQWP